MDEIRLQQLLARYFDNTINKEDCEEILKYLDDGHSSSISAAIDQVLEKDRPTITFDPQRQENSYTRLITDIRERQADIQEPPLSPTRYFKLWLRIAAMLAIVFSLAFLLHLNSSENDRRSAIAEKNDDILLPDQNQALLTLADGRTITLTDTSNHILAFESGLSIRREKDGSIVFDIKQTDAPHDGSKYNTLSTPKGYTCQILLPDGTKVWLNTASSIHYPVVFGTNERKISLTGEAYFEVAHDVSRPFKVEAKGSVIKVLGTHFNVSAFEDEAEVTTTLLEGSVNVSKSNRHVVLEPGEQAVVDETTGKISQSQVDISAVTAWKNGYFRFDNEPIKSIMSKISRWYDIDTVEYKGQFNDRFTGTFQRSKGVSVLFSHLEKLASYAIEIKERRVIITK